MYIMDLKQIEYILKIAEENNITHAAEKLFITQSALNQQLLKLERELGTELFHRSRTDWHPTKAGEIYIHAAKEILHIKQNTYNQIFDLEHQRRGKLSIGFTPNRGTSMFSAVYPKFHEKHPQIMVEPRELCVSEQLSLIADHALDIGFLTILPQQKRTSLSYTPIKTEEIFLAVPAARNYLHNPIELSKDNAQVLSKNGSKKESTRFPVLSLHQLKSESFVLLYRQSTIRRLVDSLFRNAGFVPDVLFETANTYTILNMIEANLCCGLIPEYYVDENNCKIQYFSLPEHPTWDIAACCSLENYTSDAAKDFIDLAKAYWHTSSPHLRFRTGSV